MASSTDHKPDDSPKQLRVLCIDGGGVRGVAAIQCLLRLQELTKNSKGETQEPHEMFDVICGTSTGGILAIMLGLLKIPLEDCMRLYQDLSKKLFTKSLLGPVANYGKRLAGKPQYDSKTLKAETERLLSEYFKRASDADGNSQSENFQSAEAKMSDQRFQAELGKTPHVFVVSSIGERPYLFRNYTVPFDCGNLGSSDSKIVDAVLATSAAPTYFEGQKNKDSDSVIDGGIGFNNPILCAAIELARVQQFQVPQKYILSLGTGGDEVMPCDGWHFVQYAYHTANVVTETEWSHECYRALCEDDRRVKYHRLNPTKIGKIKLDDADKIEELVKLTNKYLHKEFDKIRNAANDFKLIRDDKFFDVESLQESFKKLKSTVDAHRTQHQQEMQDMRNEFDGKLQQQRLDLEAKYDSLYEEKVMLEKLVEDKEKLIECLRVTILKLQEQLKAMTDDREKSKRVVAYDCINSDLRNTEDELVALKQEKATIDKSMTDVKQQFAEIADANSGVQNRTSEGVERSKFFGGSSTA